MYKLGDNTPTYKCILIGDGGTGKTTFVKRHIAGNTYICYSKTGKLSIIYLNE